MCAPVSPLSPNPTLPTILKQRGTLGESADSLYATHRLVSDTLKKAGRVFVYASLLGDEDLRNAPHTLSPETEQTLSYFSQTFGAPNETYSLLANSDIPWPTITLSNGEETVVDSQGYGRVRNSEDRDDRKLAFDTFWDKWAEYRSSVGMVMNSHLQTQVALAKARNYDSVLERELFQDNLPPI